MDFSRRFVPKGGMIPKCGRFAARIARIAATAGAAAALLAACHDGPFDEPSAAGHPVPATTTIADLPHPADGMSVNVTGDLTVSGVVTTSDRSFGFYHTLCIESDGAGMEIMAGIDRLHVDYPVGCRVTLLLKGLAIGTYRGVLQAGARPDAGSYFPTGYLASPAAVAAHLIRSSETVEPVRPTLRSAGELTAEACGTLVRIDGLFHDPEDETDRSWAGTRRFRDASGAFVYSYVRAGADFADAEIPAGRCSLVGILQYEAQAGGRYLIKLRDETDCIH